eukprot:scaffold490180_cov44-Prasinocladus_malaysianus.AAC.1
MTSRCLVCQSVKVGAEAIAGMCRQMQAWADRVGKPKLSNRVLVPEGLSEQVERMAFEDLAAAFRISKKQERGAVTEQIKSRVMESLSADADGPMHPPVMVSMAFK